MSIELYVSFLARELNTTTDKVLPEFAEAVHVKALLWPLACRFHEAAGPGKFHDEASIEADAVLEALEASSKWMELSADAARVLLERATYVLAVLDAYTLASKHVLCPKSSLNIDLQRVAVALLWLHGMKVPARWLT